MYNTMDDVREVMGCEVVDYENHMILDGYVLCSQDVTEDDDLGDRYLEIRHVKVVSADPDFRERVEKVTCKLRVLHFKGQFTEDDWVVEYQNIEDVVKAAKEKLERICRRPTELLVDKYAVSYLNRLLED